MRNLTVILLGVCIFLGASICLSANAPEPPQQQIERLSVEETLEILKTNSFVRWYSVADPQRETGLNPDARPEIYKIIAEPKEGINRSRVALFLGILGQSEDIEKLENILANFKGLVLDENQQQLVYSIIEAVHVMECRGIKTAQTVADKMMTPEYWQNLDFKVMIRNEARPAGEKFGPWAVANKGSSGDPKTKEKVKAVYNNITDESLKGKYTYQVNAVEGQYDRLMESKRTGDWTIFYGKPEATPAPTTRSLEVSRCHPEFAYEEFYTSTTLWTVPAKFAPTVEDTLCKEALTAFDAILEAVAKRDENYLVTNTAISGRPLLLKEEQNPENIEKIFAKVPDLKKKWQNLLPLVQAFQGKTQNPAQHFVQFQAGFGMNRETGGSVEAPPFAHVTRSPKSFYPFLLIRFRYDDLKDVAKKYPEIFNNKGRIPSVSENGEPYVVMIWEGDRWYWNPFGM